VVSPAIDNLVAQLTRLPGVGTRTAHRLAFHLLRTPKDEALALLDDSAIAVTFFTAMEACAVGSLDKMRLDVTGSASKVSPMMSDSVSMIVTDSGKTITYLDKKKSQYLRVRPTEIVNQAQQMGGMKMEFSGTEAKVDSLGAGGRMLQQDREEAGGHHERAQPGGFHRVFRPVCPESSAQHHRSDS